MLLPLLRLLCVSLCSEAVFSHSHDGQQQQKTKGTFTPGDYESTATNRNAHKARSGSGTSWRAAAAAAAREDRGGVVNGNNAARAQQQHQHHHLHDATLNSVARRGASRAVRKTQHPKKGPRGGGGGRAEDGDGGEGPWRARGEAAAAAAAMATHGRRGCSHGKSDVNYPVKSNKKHEQMCRRKKTAYSRQRRDVKGGQRDGEASQAASLAMWEALPKPLAQEQGTDFPFNNESSDYEQFTLPNIFDFIPKNTNGRRKHVRNPFYPITAESYGAYALVIFSAIVFTVGILGNIAIMCIVCHNYYMRSISNSLLANLAFWDFVVIFFCLPLVTFHELTKNWLLGEFSCKVIPYIEVVSLGVTTFTLCALCIDRFRAATNVQMYYEMIENCCSTGAKLAVIWVGALLLALPEILIRQLVVEDGEPPDLVPRERCVVRISTELPDTLYVLGLTYDGARLWWYFGCYFCLPTLFTICCSLVTARKIRGAERAAVRGTKKQIHLESQMNCVVVALAILYGFCIIPENICNIVSVYMAASVPRRALDILHLVSQLLLFCKSAVTPVLLLCLCQPFSRAFLDCCCCCCAECAADPSARRTSSIAATTTSDNDNECTTTELELSPFSTIRREVSSPYASVGTHC